MHFTVFLWGFTGPLGELIPLSGLSLVWWRMGLAALGFLGILWLRKSPLKAVGNWKHLVGIGAVLAVHWVMFFEAIRQSNVSVALVFIATAPLMTALIEPLFTRKRIRGFELLLGALTLIGIYLCFAASLDYALGIGLAIGAAGTSALYGILNKYVAHPENPTRMNLYEIGGGWLFLSILLPVYWTMDPNLALAPPAGLSWLWLGILAFACTTWAYILSLSALRHVTAFNYVLAINLEPIYGILIAILFIGERHALDLQFATGAVIVFSSVFVYPLFQRWASGIKSLRRSDDE
jgi:drug/metabolite transporter (DMT)-like permease